MRTYNRKKVNLEVIRNVKSLCRLCLGRPVEAVPIFNDSSDVCAALAIKITICVGLEVSHDENLPNIICKECLKELEQCSSFRKKCEVSYQRLKAHLQAVKQQVLKGLEKSKEVDEYSLIYNTQSEDVTDVINCSEIVNEQSNGLRIVDNTQQPPEEIEQYAEGEQAPDIATFLSSLLVEVGVLQRSPCGLAFVKVGLQAVQLHALDADYTLELVEESDPEEDIEIYATEAPVAAPADSAVQCSSEAPKEAVAEKGARHACEVCGKRLASRSALVRHRRAHSAHRPHACASCGRRFHQRAVLLRHQLTHSADRPFKCLTCDKGFTQRSALAAHSRRHAPAAPCLRLHRCPRCPKVFLYQSGLSRHLKTHAGRVFVCGACSRPFNDKSSLLRHMRLAHADRPLAAKRGTNTAEAGTAPNV